MTKRKTSVMIEENIWDSVKIHCIKQKKEIGIFLEELLTKELKIKK